MYCFSLNKEENSVIIQQYLDTITINHLVNMIFCYQLVYLSKFQILPIKLCRILINDLLEKLNISPRLKRTIENQCIDKLKKYNKISVKKINRNLLNFDNIEILRKINIQCLKKSNFLP